MTAIAKSAKTHPAAKKCCGWEQAAICHAVRLSFPSIYSWILPSKSVTDKQTAVVIELLRNRILEYPL